MLWRRFISLPLEQPARGTVKRSYQPAKFIITNLHKIALIRHQTLDGPLLLP